MLLRTAFFQRIDFNPLMLGGNRKVIYTYTNVQLKAADLFKFL